MLVLVALALTVAVLVGTVGLAGVVTDRARAAAAADAAALAAAARGPEAAQQVAGDDHAVLVALERSGDEVRATVRVGRATATARARWVPVAIP